MQAPAAQDGRADIEDYEARACADVVRRPEGFAYRCSFCDRPAVLRAWAWHRLWGYMPVFPRVFSYCDAHQSHRGGKRPADGEDSTVY